MNETMFAPYSEDAERAVLSAMLTDERAIPAAQQLVSAADFFRASHAELFGAIAAAWASGQRIDPITVSAGIVAENAREAAKNLIGDLIDEIPTSEHVTHHAAIVRERAKVRGLLDVARSVESLAKQGKSATELAQHLFQSALPHSVDDDGPGFRHVRDLLYATMESIERRAIGGGGLRTGYAQIDNWTNGFRPGELVIPAGAEKSGKSALAFNIGLRVLEREAGRVGVGYVSAEMTADSLIERALSRATRIDSTRLGSGKLVDEEWSLLSRAAGELAKAPFFIDDEAEPSLADVIARCTHLKATHEHIGLIIVDFLQLVTAREKGLSDAVELKRIAYGLKKLAKRLGVVVIAPCQVNTKDVEATKDMRPQLKDLQGSSGMRQAADFIALMFRPGLYDEMSENADTMELNFAACRRGPRFTARLKWTGATLTISE